MSDSLNYFPYYHRSISNFDNGLNLVVGGTGLGKTSAIPHVVRELLSAERKAIYVANRISLLEEMKEKFHAEECVFLRRDLAVVREALQTQFDAFQSLLNEPQFEAHKENVDVAQLRRTSQQLRSIFQNFTEPQLKLTSAESDASHILRDIRRVMHHARAHDESAYQWLLDAPIIQRLFPFIAFKRNPTVRILLVTLQKLFHGAFDGERTITLQQLGGYVIFCDEFDFLENDLLTLICESPQIENPARFVDTFYRELTRHKAPYPDYLNTDPDLKRRIDEIQTDIAALNQDDRIGYPSVSQFIRDAEAHQHHAILFRTTHTISTQGLYLERTPRGFRVLAERNDNTFHASYLLGKIDGFTKRILTLLKQLERTNDVLQRDLVDDWFRDTDFIPQIRRITQFPHRNEPAQPTQLGNLLNAGYSLFDIHERNKASDPEEVDLRRYAIFVTPEKIMAMLAAQNLVFGLSATADIPRQVKHFNLAWLREQVTVIEPSAEDIELVKALNAAKAAKRSNLVSVRLVQSSDDKQLNRIVERAKDDPAFTETTSNEYVLQRVYHFFDVLRWAIDARTLEQRQTDSHLVFLTTYRQIKYIFDQFGNQYPLFTAKPRQQYATFEVYDLNLQLNGQTQPFIVVFYNAEQARAIRQDTTNLAAYHELFREGKPLILLTQYSSAGNGVNLQYKPRLDSDEELDFQHLHILELPYFYFNGIEEANDTYEEQIAKVKANIWYQAKLHAAKLISTAEFRRRLTELRQPKAWNSDYQRNQLQPDYFANSLAALIQVLGRIERVWRENMPDQTVHLCNDAYGILQNYLSKDEYADLRVAREPIVSDNLRRILQQVAEQTRVNQRKAVRAKDERLRERNLNCIQQMKALIDAFPQIRAGAPEARSLRYKWHDLRRTALRHEFEDKLLKDFSAAYKSVYVAYAEVRLDSDMAILPRELAVPETYTWHLDEVYRLIRGNDVICNHFADHGYELAFNPESQHFFVPYFYQAILMGAIGEEAITALLEHKGNGVALEDMPDVLFEVADLKVAGRPTYIDCKNYSEFTLGRFALAENDALYHPKFSEAHFKQRAIKKWQQIAEQHGETSRLIYINLASVVERPLQYFDADFNLVTGFNDARIVLLQGALESANVYQTAFKRLIADLINEE